MATVQINRDPFARASLMRQTVQTYNGQKLECAWCGQPAKFRYFWRSDSSNDLGSRSFKVFCSISCWRSYES